MSTLTYRLFIFIVAALSFIPFLGGVHLFDWDEINFAEAAREMVVSGNFSTVTIDYLPFWEKPPLFFWMQAISMKIFGINEFAARFPNAIAGIITLLLFFELGKKLVSENFGLMWSMLYLCSVLPHLYFKSGIIDPWFNLFIFSGIVCTFFYTENNKGKFLFWAGIFIGLAVLTKGPVGLLIYGLVALIFLGFKKFKNFPSFQHILFFLIGLLLFGGFWVISETLQGRFYIIADFFTYQVRLLQTGDAGHSGPFYYHFFVLLIGCFPLSAYAIPVIISKVRLQENPFEFTMKILFWVVLILFSIVKTKIVHYSSLAYFPLSFLGAFGLQLFIINNKRKAVTIGLLSLSILWVVLLFALAWVGNNPQWILNNITIKDPFVIDALNYPSPFTAIDFLPAIVLAVGTLLFIMQKENIRKVSVMLSFSFLSFMLAFALFVPKIERFSQGGAIDFFKSKKNKVVYPLGYKSYAHLFYAEKMPQQNDSLHQVNLTLKANTTDSVFFITKINKQQKIEKSHPELIKLKSDRGFVFYVKP